MVSFTSAYNFLKKTFVAFKAKQKGDLAWLESRIDTATQAREAISKETVTWLDKVASLTGVSTTILKAISELFQDDEFDLTTIQALDRLFVWLKNNPGILLSIVRPENVGELFGSTYEALKSVEEKGSMALPLIEKLLKLWLTGRPLCEIEAAHPKPDMTRCKHARHFALRLTSDLAFVAGLPARLITARNTGKEMQLPAAIETLASAVKEGCDCPEALAARLGLGRNHSRPSARQHYEELKPFFQAPKAKESFEDTRQRYRDASAIRLFSANPID